MGLVADGAARPEQVGAFLLALRMKGEGADELAGSSRRSRRAATPAARARRRARSTSTATATATRGARR